ncbi:MAG: hypothetical protein WCY37_00590 [Candidatus Dojkabacteria bacterium]
MDEIKQKINEFGLPQKESEELFEALSEEVLEIVFHEYADKTTDEELTVMENRIREAKSPEQFETIIAEIATTIFGENAEEEIRNIYSDLLEQFKTAVEEAKQLAERAQAGDPDALKLIEKAQQTEDYHKVMDELAK